MKDCAISVIVPVYNVENTIRKSLDSILSQTFKSFEVLLIDDGSSDNSGSICDEYSIKDKRIRVFHKQNEGVSATRQFGIDNAIGEYTIHVDPDDWVEQRELEDMYQYAISNEADIVISDFYVDNPDGTIIYKNQEPTALVGKELLHDCFRKIHGCLWAKLIKRSLYSDYNIHFPIGINYCEDQYITCSILKHNVNVCYLNKAYYHYVQHPSSTTAVSAYNEKTYESDIRLINTYKEMFSDDKELIDLMLGINGKSMVCRAFYNGRSFYTSTLFKQKFHPYVYYVKTKGRLKDKLFVVPACYGFYSIMYTIYRTTKKIKSHYISLTRQFDFLHKII